MNQPTKPKPDFQLTPEKTLELLTQLASGLLATGHYTRPVDEDEDDQSTLIRSFWTDHNGKRKCHSAIAEAATRVFFDLQQQMEKEWEWENE